MPFNYDETKPGDSDVVSQFPANERAARNTVKAALAVEHDTAEGRHKFGVGNTAARDAITTWVDGAVWFNTTDARNIVQVRSSSAWLNASSEFAAGTKIIFRQSSAPTGWTLDTDANDAVLRIRSSATGFGSGGSWTISGLSTESAQHVHPVTGGTGAEDVAHSHDVSVNISTGAPAGSFSFQAGGTAGVSTSHTHNVAFTVTSTAENVIHTHPLSLTSGVENATHTHTHDGAWRPSYTDVIACAKA